MSTRPGAFAAIRIAGWSYRAGPHALPSNDASVALNVVTLGLSPTRHIFVHVSASALLIDTRTGFIYAALEANEHRKLLTNAWESRESADRARQDAERAAFKSLVGEFDRN